MLIEKYISGSFSYLITFKEDKTSYLNLASSLLDAKRGIGGDYLIVVNKENKEIEIWNKKEKERNYIPSSLFVVHTFLKRHNLIEEPFYKISYNNKTYPLHCLERRVVIPLGEASLIKELISVDEIEIQGHKIKFSSLFLNEPLLVFYEDDIYSSFVYNHKEEILSHPLFKNKFSICIISLSSEKEKVYIYNTKNIEFALGGGAYIAYLTASINLPLSLYYNDELYVISNEENNIYLEGQSSFICDCRFYEEII